MKKGKTSSMIYGIIAVVAVILMFYPSFDKGIDFTGGRNYVVSFNDVQGVNTQDLTDHLNANETIGDASIKVITISRENQVRFVCGAIWAILVSLVVIALYILFRFRNVAFSIGAIVGLAANVLVILGLYCLLPRIMWFSMEIDQAFIAAILTVIGYSINDIVVVFDHIREVSGLYPNRNKYDVINESLNMTMPRTLNTSISTLLVLVVIFFFGGASIQSFIFAMLVGVVVDPLTTIFLAVPAAYHFMHKEEKKAQKA